MKSARSYTPRMVACLGGRGRRRRHREQAAAPLFAGYERMPAYQRTFERAVSPRRADMAGIGDEATVRARLEAFASAGVTDFCAGDMRIGPHPDLTRNRTLDVLQSLT